MAADLRGYGDSGKPPADDHHANYSKREMARDGVELMKSLGFPQFSILAHDRGPGSPIAWPSITPITCNACCCSISPRPCRCMRRPTRPLPVPIGTGSS
ncbi:alpha/beta fold hydrolase [Pseudomonas sp. NFX15]|uniref:alpha/beta fold hydrolase n=1 Tax=Pseudomonas sp. NFX15 TaxID=2816958 RepID=UPI003B9F8C52